MVPYHVLYDFDTTGPTACGANENPDATVTVGEPGRDVTALPFRRAEALTCEDETDDAFSASGFSAAFEAARRMEALVICECILIEYFSTAEVNLIVSRSADGPTELRLTVEWPPQTSEVFTVDTTPRLITVPFTGLFGGVLELGIEARGGSPDGLLHIHHLEIGGLVVPVELTRFEGRVEGTTVHLDWATTSETNNAGFEVQVRRARSDDYEPLGFVEGHGTTTEAQDYGYSVSGLEPGTYAFRLKQIDFDGRFEVHGEVEVTVGVPGTFVLSEAYPNPFNPQARFTLAVAETQPVRVSVYDALGRRVADLFDGVLDGGRTHPFAVDGAGLASGLHVIQVVGATFSASRSVTLLR